MLLNSEFIEPIKIGCSELVSINQLVDIVEDITGVKLKRRYKLDAPKGVNGRNSDNTLIQKVFGWEPSTKLRASLDRTYQWIYDEVIRKQAAGVNGFFILTHEAARGALPAWPAMWS